MTKMLDGVWLAAALLAVGCTPERPAPVTEREQQPASPASPAASGGPTASPAAADRTPPTIADARDAVKRVFSGAVALTDGRRPSFLTGDLNGDGFTDLVAVVRPDPGSVPLLNDELANWILREPRAAAGPQPKRTQVAPDDLLLVVLHGVGPSGWRSPDARQAWVLRGVVGDGLRVVRRGELRPAGAERLPPIMGDVLAESLEGKAGFLFWTGAKYAWHPPP